MKLTNVTTEREKEKENQHYINNWDRRNKVINGTNNKKEKYLIFKLN